MCLQASSFPRFLLLAFLFSVDLLLLGVSRSVTCRTDISTNPGSFQVRALTDSWPRVQVTSGEGWCFPVVGSAGPLTLHVCRTVHQPGQLVYCAGPEDVCPAITLPWAHVEGEKETVFLW